MRRRLRRVSGIAAFLVAMALLTSCTASRPAPGAAASAGSPSGPPLSRALVNALPSACDGVAAPASSSVSFVAGGRTWAVSPDDPGGLHCLFSSSDTGLFSWGPRGDRVVLTGMAVRGVGTSVSRPAGNFHPSYFSWSRPTGTTLVFTDQARQHLFRADVGVATARDITPVQGETYGDIAYHPSGLSIGFVTMDPAGSFVRVSTNTGTLPSQLEFSKTATFGHLVFSHDGKALLYSVDEGDRHALARLDLTSGSDDHPGPWSGSQPIADIVELAGVPGVALTVGATCAQHQAIFSAMDGTSGQILSTGAASGTPVSVVGRLDADRFVLAAGGCGARRDLWIAHRSSQAPTLLVEGVDAAAMRQAEPTPAPELPPGLLPRSGFA